jgi:hypothetical protein
MIKLIIHEIKRQKIREVWIPFHVLLHNRYHHSNDGDEEGDHDKEDKIHPPVLSLVLFYQFYYF